MSNSTPIYIPRASESERRTPRFRQDRKRELRIWWREIDRWLLFFVQ